MCPYFFLLRFLHSPCFFFLNRYLERDHYLVELGVFSYQTIFLSTPSVGAEFLVDESMFLRTPSVGASCICGCT